MDSANKVLGTISAIDTFLENFPMSILDMMGSNVYTSAFDYIVDVLVACGVPVNEIMTKIIEKIYGLEQKVDGGIEDLYERLSSGEIEFNTENNEFMEGLEEGVKVIFMALLSSFYTCAAIPVLPNKMFDAPNPNLFKEYEKNKETGVMEEKKEDAVITLLKDNRFKPFLVPKKAIDPMGLLDITPTSKDGRLYYDVDGKDIYYQKVTETVKVVKEIKQIANSRGEYKYNTVVPMDEYKQAYIYIVKNDDNTYTFCTNGDIENIEIEVTYELGGANSSLTRKYGTKTNNIFDIPLYSFGDENKKNVLLSFKMNGVSNSFEILNGGEKTWVYLNKDESEDFYEEWKNYGSTSFPWGEENNSKIMIESATTKECYEGEIYAEEILVDETKYIYKSIDDIHGDAKRVNVVPEDVHESSPEFIVCYNGLNPNILYKTNDMNAFLWYALHKGMKTPQIEYNHMMWDSRIKASKRGIARKTPTEWNQWYNSKSTAISEFTYFGSIIDNNTPLYPIIQLAPQGMAENLLVVKLPAQRYFRPRTRKSNLDNDSESKNVSFNSSIYKFNWDYLQSIRIFKPKILLVSLLEKVLGICVSTIKSADINLSKKLIESKISTAIKNVMESNDMDVEDCYMAFSNDDVNAMLEEMLLSRYTSTIHNSNGVIAKQHNIDGYIGLIDQYNVNASMQGTSTSITKMLNEIEVTPGSEGSENYGFGDVDVKGATVNFLKKILKAILSSITESLFTPQLILLIYINFELLGVTKNDHESFANADLGKLLNIILNKMFRLLKSIILFCLEKILQILLEFLLTKILPKIIKWKLLLILEQIEAWMKILMAAIKCLPIYLFQLPKYLNQIEDVQYADIEKTQSIPESSLPC